MFRAILVQVIVTVIATIAAGVVAGARGALSAAAGGGVCILPNLLFAWRLRSLSSSSSRARPLNFMLAELFKLVLIFLLLVAVVRIYAELHWPSMLIGLVLASQAMFLAFWKRADHVDRS